MELIALLMGGSGGLLVWCGITGRAPTAVFLAIVSGNKMPSSGSWLPLASETLVRAADPIGATFGEGGTPGEPGAAPSSTGGAIGSTINSSGLTPQQAAVLAYAHAQLGKPYVWDEAGPSSFDCSGLVLAAYNTVGIHLPHHASDQEKYGVEVPLSQAQPGDLVFWGPISKHVAIYIGNGQVIQAPHTGSVVQVSNLWDQKDIRVRRLLSNSGAGKVN